VKVNGKFKSLTILGNSQYKLTIAFAELFVFRSAPCSGSLFITGDSLTISTLDETWPVRTVLLLSASFKIL
jgi:hypothetical protein